MAESSYPTIGHEQADVFVLPIKNVDWAGFTLDQTMARAQFDRLQTATIGPIESTERKRYELGRLLAMDTVAPRSIDKPVSFEWSECGIWRIENLLGGLAYNASSDITQDTYEVDQSEICVLIHKLDDSSPTRQVIESSLVWRAVTDNRNWSIPANLDDDIKASCRLTGEHSIITANAAGKVVPNCLTAVGGVLTPLLATCLERDDWNTDDDGTADRSILTANPAAGDTAITVADATWVAAGQDILIWTSASEWETNRVVSVNAGTNVITLQDALDNDFDVGAVVKRTMGYALFVTNATVGGLEAYLELGDDYREIMTGGVWTIIPVDGGTAISGANVCWVAYMIPSGDTEWVDNDTDLYGITPDCCRLVVDSSNDYSTSTVGLLGVAVTEDTLIDFISSGAGADDEWISYEFTAANSGKVKSVVAHMGKTGAPAGEMIAQIYTNNAGAPNAALGNPSNPVAHSTLTAAARGSDTTFTWVDGPELTASTVYHIVWKTSNYTYADGVTEVFLDTDADGDAANDPINTGDGAESPAWVNEPNAGAEVSVTLMGAHVVKRIQGMDVSVNFNRTARYEMGNDTAIDRPFESTDITANVPMFESDITTVARLTNKNPDVVKTLRPEQAPTIYARLEIYKTADKLPADILKCIELTVKRTSQEQGATANDVGTKRVSLTGEEFAITPSL